MTFRKVRCGQSRRSGRALITSGLSRAHNGLKSEITPCPLSANRKSPLVDYLIGADIHDGQ